VSSRGFNTEALERTGKTASKRRSLRQWLG
jgi:hypothetical protein